MTSVDARSPVGSRVASSNHRSAAAGTGRLSVDSNGTARQLSSSTSSSTSTVLAVKPPVLPSRPPDVVQQWLKKEDWEALSNAWAAAEAQAISWEEGELDDPFEDMFDDEFDESWPDVDFGASQSASSQASTASPTFSSSEARPSKSRRKPWNEDFHLIGQDSRKPAPLRRYFDSLPSETSPKREAVRPGMRPKAAMTRGEDEFEPDSPSEPWNSTFGSLASTDNDGLHPHLRHYFDRRGLEATYKMRPHCDHKWLQALPPRTPGRPSTREKLLRWSSSEPALGGSPLASTAGSDKLDVKARGMGSITWGNRCLIYGPNANVTRGLGGEKIPWVYDHGVVETDDNDILNPLLRHYFDADGIESSYRNRGRNYGRPTKMCFGMPPIEHKHTSPKPKSKKAKKGQLQLSDAASSPKSGAVSKRSFSVGAFGSAAAGETFPKAPGAKRLPGKRETASAAWARERGLSVLVALEAEHTGRRSVGQRSAPGGLLAAAVPGASSPTARSTGQHSSPAAFGERPSPGNKLAERRRNSTATMKELVPLEWPSPGNKLAERRGGNASKVPSVADKVSVASTGEFHDPVDLGSGGKFAGDTTFGAEAFTAAVSSETAAGEHLSATASFGGALSPSGRRHDTAEFGLVT